MATDTHFRSIHCLDNIQTYFLFIVETVNSGFVIAMMYEPLVLRYGKVSASLLMSLFVQNVPVRNAGSHYILSIRYVKRSQHCRITKPKYRSPPSGSSDDGNPEVYKFFSGADSTFQQVLVSTPVQIFIAWRIKVITKSKILAGVIGILALIAFGR